MNFHVVKVTAKGERVDRSELRDIEQMFRSRKLDIFILEDIGRLVRGTAAKDLIGIAVDHGVRVISPNDCIDTAEEWEQDAISACREHVGSNAHTSKRIKHKCMNRFLKMGGCTRCEIYGYIKPLGTKTYEHWQVDPAAKQIYEQWFAKLKEYPNCTAIADWLNDQKIKPGKYSRRSNWDGKMVRRITANPLLKGMPYRGRLYTKKHNETGRRICAKNPDGPQYYPCPHLQVVDSALFDEVNEIISKQNQKLGRKVSCNTDPRSQFPQKRSRFPGGIATCWYCGRTCVWGANGQRHGLMCPGAREWLCWCSFGFSGGYAQSKIAKALEDELFALKDFGQQYVQLVALSKAQDYGSKQVAQAKLNDTLQSLAQKKANVKVVIAAHGLHSSVKEMLDDIVAEEHRLSSERQRLANAGAQAIQLPQTIPALREVFASALANLAQDSFEFNQIMRRIISTFAVYLVRLCDGGEIYPRAKVVFELAGLVPHATTVDGLPALLRREITIDLFEPPQREKIREQAVYLASQGLEQREIAAKLRGNISQTVVWKALRLDAKMRELGLKQPYTLVSAPPEDYAKLRRYKSSRFKFSPLAGYEPPPL